MSQYHSTDPDAIVNADETTPLLATEPSTTQQEDSQQRQAEYLEENVDSSSRPIQQSTRVLTLVCTLLMLLDIAGFLGLAPQMQIFEDIICQNYYSHQPSQIDTLPVNERCKIEPVQSELAIIQAYKDTFDQLPGIFLGVIYGLLADRVGRKPVLLCGILGLTLSGLWVKAVCWFPEAIPLKLVYLSAPILIFGGGAQVASSMFYVMLADSYSEEERATSFFYFSAVVLTAEIVATPISGLTMTENPWLPFLLSSGVEFLAVVVAILFAPETLPVMKPKSSGTLRSSTTESNENTPSTKRAPFVKTVVAKISDSLKLIKESTHFLSTNLNVSLLLLVFFVATLSRQAMALLLQYATKKYHWSYSKATILISVRGAVNLAAVLVILPFLSRLLLKRLKIDAPSKDLWLSRGTALLLTIGMLLMFSAPAPAILIIGLVAVALGSPLHLTARSLITSLVLPNQVGVLYTSLAVVQSVGILIAGPLLANTFRWGMKLGDTWLGLPFLAASVMFLLSFLLISAVNLSRRPRVHSVQSAGEGSRT